MNNKFKAQTLTGNPIGNSQCHVLASRALNLSCSFGQSARSIENRCMVMQIIKLVYYTWASYQIRNIAGCACTGNARGVFPHLCNPDMYQGTCVTHVLWCMQGSLTSSFLSSQWWEKRFRHSLRTHSQQFCVSGKRSMLGCWSILVQACQAGILAS